jgi:dTDP-4-amino-4,6-dideoxygalactose transaminase
LNLAQAEIILPAYTCKIMPAVVVATGNVPVFVDIDLADYNMNLRALKSAITTRTKVIVATHMFGYPVDVDAIREIADDARITIVEDAALAFPGSTSDPNGLRGDVGLFSFGPQKPLFTVRGGAVVTDNPALYEKLSFYRNDEMNHLLLRERVKRWTLLVIHYLLSKRAISTMILRLRLSKSTVYNVTSRLRPVKNGQPDLAPSLPGDYATRYANFQARIGLSQLRKSDRILARRRSVAELYGQALREIPGLTPAPIVDGACYSLYTVRVENRDALHFCQQMRAQGIETGTTFNYALPDLKKYRPYAQGHYPCAQQTSREVVNLPAYTTLTDEQIHRIADTARRILCASY